VRGLRRKVLYCNNTSHCHKPNNNNNNNITTIRFDLDKHTAPLSPPLDPTEHEVRLCTSSAASGVPFNCVYTFSRCRALVYHVSAAAVPPQSVYACIHIPITNPSTRLHVYYTRLYCLLAT